MLGLPLCGLLGHSKLKKKKKWVQEVLKPPMQIISPFPTKSETKDLIILSLVTSQGKQVESGGLETSFLACQFGWCCTTAFLCWLAAVLAGANGFPAAFSYVGSSQALVPSGHFFGSRDHPRANTKKVWQWSWRSKPKDESELWCWLQRMGPTSVFTSCVFVSYVRLGSKKGEDAWRGN